MNELEENSKGEKEGRKMLSHILKNYENLEKSIVAQLNMLCEHGPTIGTLRETIWKEMFQQIIPKKFTIEQSVFIIDSKGNVSNEVDLAIMDEMYTPYIFRYGKIKLVPIEAVAVVVECKSSDQKLKDLEKMSNSLKKLRANPESIARIASGILKKAPKSQKSTRPIQILCNMNNKNGGQLKQIFDIVISAEKDKLKIDYTRNELRKWFKELNFYNVEMTVEEETIKEDLSHGKNEGDRLIDDYKIEGNTLLSLNFQLNQLLMLINNPMPFPHLAYAKMFEEINQIGKGLSK